jgi:cytochrome c-type biogenesis protein CcmE
LESFCLNQCISSKFAVMKKIHIIGLVLIAVAVAVIIAFSSDYTSYENFSKANANPGKVYNIVGLLAEDREFEYDPQKDPNHFVFYMVDNEGAEQKVVYGAPKPQDFERSEQIVVTGKSVNDVFYADKILMKCPSKYVEDEIEFIEAKSY